MQETPFVRNGKTLLSGIDPVRRCERTADAVVIKDRTLYFCPSPLYGYGLSRLLSRLEKEAPDSAVLCIEADGELYELSLKSGVPQLAPEKKLRITDIRDSAQLCAFVRKTWGARSFRRVETVRFSGGWQLFPQLYDALCEALRREIAVDWSNALTLAKLGRLYIRNALRNLPLVARFPGISSLSFGDVPVLVLGAGPSLDETLDALAPRYVQTPARESRPFKIVCVDTCLGALKDRNITPDLVVILESQHWNLRDFVGCRGWDVPFVADLSALPESVLVLGEDAEEEITTELHGVRHGVARRKEKGGAGFLFMTPWTSLKIFERLKNAGLLPDAVPPLGSVGLTAVEIARRLGSGKIICAGLDFSFTPDKYHARGTPGHRNKLNTQTRFRGLLNNAVYDAGTCAAVSKSGLPVYSSPAMQNYRDLFKQEFGGDTRLFDVEGTGLPLGVKTLLMEDALALLEDGRIFTTELHGGGHGVTRREERKEKKEEGKGKREKRREEKEERKEKREKREEERDKLTEKVLNIFEGEKKRLVELRDILTGETTARERLAALVEECDYLWAHFPDCTGRMPELEDNSPSTLSFLKRLRAEIDPMMSIINYQ